MKKITIHCFGVSLDGYSAGPSQSLDHPLGIGGLGLMEWFFRTRTFQRMHNRELGNVPHHLFGQEDGEAGLDDDFAARSFQKIGAWIIGRNTFGPVRGRWANDDWKGWWGDDPIFHCDVFVLTHHARAPVKMEGRQRSIS